MSVVLLSSVRRDLFENRETRRLQSVGIHVHNLRVGNVLEKPHGSVLYVFPKNGFDRLFLAGVHRWVLENASVSVRALARVLQEVLTHRCQILFVKSSLWLKFMLPVSKAATLLLFPVLALKAFQPKFAKLSSHFRLPLVLVSILVCTRRHVGLRFLQSDFASFDVGSTNVYWHRFSDEFKLGASGESVVHLWSVLRSVSTLSHLVFVEV